MRQVTQRRSIRSVAGGVVMANDDWLESLYKLTYRFPELGVGPDLAALSLYEAWGLYCFLRRLSEGG